MVSKSLEYINENNTDFYDQLQDEIDSDMARLKKSVAVVKNLRLTAAEMEVETAALYHAELWHDIEKLNGFTKMQGDGAVENADRL